MMIEKTAITDAEREEIRAWIKKNPTKPYKDFMVATKDKYRITCANYCYLRTPKETRQVKEKEKKKIKRNVYLTVFSKAQKEVNGKPLEILKEFLEVLKENGRVKFEMVEVTNESKERYIEIREY